MKINHVIFFALFAFKSLAGDTNEPNSAIFKRYDAAVVDKNINTNTVTPDDVIAAIRADKNYFNDALAFKMMNQRKQFISTLLNIFRDVRASADQKCAAAYYLGEIHAPEAVDDLATNIALHISPGAQYGGVIEPSIAVALVKIGTPSISVLIKNLLESDDEYVQKSSLTVLYSIEGDKDVVQLRLQRALDAQSDTAKKNRLQTALKSLPEIRMQPGVVD